jgi:hypothetical protein
MKSFQLSFFCMAIAVSVVPISAAEAFPPPELKHFLFHILKQLPPHSAGYTRIEKLTGAIIRMDPSNAYKYCNIGLSRITPTESPDVSRTRFIRKAQHAVRLSNLSTMQKQVQLRRLNAVRSGIPSGSFPPSELNAKPQADSQIRALSDTLSGVKLDTRMDVVTNRSKIGTSPIIFASIFITILFIAFAGFRLSSRFK